MTDTVRSHGITAGHCDYQSPTKPIPWSRARELVTANTPESLSKLRRSTEQTWHYKERRAQMLTEYASLVDSVKIRILDYAFVLNKDVLKEFPYFFEEAMEHDVIWSETELTDVEVDSIVRQNRQGYETVWFRNPPPLQSIPDLWHVHILSHPQTIATTSSIEKQEQD